MTPKEKAQELVGKCFDTFINDEDEFHDKTAWRLSKQCALIAVDEMLKNAGFIWGGNDTETGLSARDKYRNYFQEVKQEIEKL